MMKGLWGFRSYGSSGYVYNEGLLDDIMAVVRDYSVYWFLVDFCLL